MAWHRSSRNAEVRARELHPLRRSRCRRSFQESLRLRTHEMHAALSKLGPKWCWPKLPAMAAASSSSLLRAFALPRAPGVEPVRHGWRSSSHFAFRCAPKGPVSLPIAHTPASIIGRSSFTPTWELCSYSCGFLPKCFSCGTVADCSWGG